MEKSDSIEREITVAGSIEKVWRALTQADELAQWFGDSAELELKPGGAFRVGWSGYNSIVEGVVETVDYPTLFSYRWEAGWNRLDDHGHLHPRRSGRWYDGQGDGNGIRRIA